MRRAPLCPCPLLSWCIRPLCDWPLRRGSSFHDPCFTFQWAAAKTWRDIHDTQHWNNPIPEDSITDMLLLEMRRLSSSLIYKRFTRHEESKDTGADWLWWFVSKDGKCGLPILLQAKRLFNSLRYESLKYKTSRADQTNTLLRYAQRCKFVPMFAFYNHWDSQQSWLHERCSNICPQWGCSIAPAKEVKRALKSHGPNGNHLERLGPISMPWCVLVCPAPAKDELPDRVRRSLLDFFRLRVVPAPVELPDYVRRLMLGSAEDADGLPPEALPFLKGLVVVSDRPIEERG